MSEDSKVVKLYESKNQLTTDAVDKIVVEVFNKRKDEASAQTIVLTGCSPLVGTTSTCIGLSIAIATTQRRTLLIDCDVRKSIKYKKLNDATSVGLANYLVQDSDEGLHIDDVIYSTNINNLSYIPCGNCSESSTRILCSTRMEKLLEAVKEKFDCVIFDFPSLAVVPDAQILFNEVDGIVLLAALGETRKKQIKDAKLKVAPYMDKYYGMIINKVRMDVYKKNVRDYNYYFVDKTGEQKFKGNAAYKKYKKNAGQAGGEQSNEEK